MSFHEIIHTILKNIRSILKITILSALIIFLILFLIYPNTYKATVKILPPPETNQISGLGSLLSSVDLSSMLFGAGVQGNSQLYIEILKSRSAAFYVINKLRLQDYFDSEDIQEAAQKLSSLLETELSKEGIVTLSVEVKSKFLPKFIDDEDSLKRFSANLSNTFIEALDNINREKLSSRAKNARQYIEQQLSVTKVVLDSVENELMLFQKNNKTISLPDQIKVAIENAAQLKSEIMKTEIEIGLLKNSFTENNKMIISLEKKLSELRQQYSKFEMGDEDYLVAFKDVPEVGKKLASLLRDVKIQNEVYLLLQQQFYKEKIQENKDIPTVDVLDEALPPSKKSSPKVVFSTIFGSIFIFFTTSLIFVLKENKLHALKKYFNNRIDNSLPE